MVVTFDIDGHKRTNQHNNRHNNQHKKSQKEPQNEAHLNLRLRIKATKLLNKIIKLNGWLHQFPRSHEGIQGDIQRIKVTKNTVTKIIGKA